MNRPGYTGPWGRIKTLGSRNLPEEGEEARGLRVCCSLRLVCCECHTEWAQNRGAAMCPESGGWEDGDHNPSESVMGYGLERNSCEGQTFASVMGARRTFSAERLLDLDKGSLTLGFCHLSCSPRALR